LVKILPMPLIATIVEGRERSLPTYGGSVKPHLSTHRQMLILNRGVVVIQEVNVVINYDIPMNCKVSSTFVIHFIVLLFLRWPIQG
jgi:hypothetical protein